MVYEPEVPDALPNFDNAIVRALRDKLERTNRIRRFKDYKLGDELGKVRGDRQLALGSGRLRVIARGGALRRVGLSAAAPS